MRLLTASALLAAAVPVLQLSTTQAYAAGTIVAQATAVDSVYGLAARLPKDTEAFASVYRLSTLWEGFKSSNFLKKVMANEELVRELKIDEAIQQWNSNPDLQQYGGMAASILGSEVTVIAPAGFTEKMTAILQQLPKLQSAYFMARPQIGGNSGPSKEFIPMLESVASLELPPVSIALKAGKHKDTLVSLLGMAVAQIPSEAKDKLEMSQSESGGGKFEHIKVTLGKAMPKKEQTQMRKDLGKAMGEEKGNALADKLLALSAEFSWGWVDDYLILSIGSGHGHLKFVSAADSILTAPEVAPRAAQFAAKNPLLFSYTSQKSLRAIGELGGLFDTLATLAEAGKTAGAPIDLDNVIAMLKQLDTKARALWPNDADAAVGAAWWEGGLRFESFGGPKPRAFDNSKPLTLGSLANDKTLLLLEGRSNGPFRDKVFELFEEAIVSIWQIYQKQVKPELPSETRQQVAMGEMVAVPMVKELWKAFQSFRGAMGNESALIVNLDGAIPSIPQINLPPDIAEKGRVPRMVWVSELADRKKLTESWSGLKTIISSAAAILGSQSGMNIPTEPTTITEGSLELYGYKLPLDTGDAWPHTAATATHWFFGTAPSLTKEIAAKSPAATGPACGSHWKVNVTALWNYADEWLKILPTPPDKEENIKLALSLARSFQGVELRFAEENGQAHDTLHLSIKDAE